MCEIMEKRIKEEINEEKLEIAEDAINQGKLSYKDIAEILKLPVSTIEEVAASIKKKDRA